MEIEVKKMNRTQNNKNIQSPALTPPVQGVSVRYCRENSASKMTSKPRGLRQQSFIQLRSVWAGWAQSCCCGTGLDDLGWACS